VCAQTKLYIANAYFIPDNTAVEIILDAKKRGVDVKIMVPGEHNDMRVARQASIHLYGKLLEMGIEIYEYQRTMLHQKMMIVDGAWVTVGTTNFDNRSFALNGRATSAYRSPAGQELERVFMDDLLVCRQVKLEDWKRRGVRVKVRASCRHSCRSRFEQ
jgi:cardiolipin synthase